MPYQVSMMGWVGSGEDFCGLGWVQNFAWRYIFNYEIMPATLVNTFLFILQRSALADLRYGGRF